MAGSHQSRLSKLEKQFGWDHPGEQQALDWYHFMVSDRLRKWILDTEYFRPSDYPKWVVDYTPPLSAERKKLMRSWRTWRRNLWKELFWTPASGKTSLLDAEFFRRAGNPKIPPEGETRKFMGYLLSRLQETAFQWGDRYLYYLYTPKHPFARYIQPNAKLIDVANTLAMFANRAEYWRNLFSQKTESSCWPNWAITLYREMGIKQGDRWIIPKPSLPSTHGESASGSNIRRGM